MAPRPTRPARTNETVSKTVGTPATKSRAKAEAAHKRGASVAADPASVPVAADGYPLVKIAIAASELIPTGSFANICVGPATIEWYIDPREDEPISSAELENTAKALNQLAEVVEIDVIAVQRNLTLESMQSQAAESAVKS